jgi:hypothetical protein
MKFRHQFNSDYNGCKGKFLDTTTVHTVPDQTMSIRTLLDRHSRGLPLGASTRQGEYFDTEVPHFDDLTDVVKYKKKLKAKEKALTDSLKKEQKLKQEKASAKAEPKKPDIKSE